MKELARIVQRILNVESVERCLKLGICPAPSSYFRDFNDTEYPVCGIGGHL